MDNLSKQEIEDIISANVGLIRSCMNKLNLHDDPDAWSAGYEALYNAILNYTPNPRVKFSSYAYTSIFNRVNGVHRSRNTQKSKNEMLLFGNSEDNDLDESYEANLYVSTANVEKDIIVKEKHDIVVQYTEKYINNMCTGLRRVVLSNWYYLHNCEVPLTELCIECDCSHAYIRKVIKEFRESLTDFMTYYY